MDKKRRYFKEYLKFGFTSIVISSIGKPQCVLCNAARKAELMKPSKIKRHLETKHTNHVTKDLKFFRRHQGGLKRQ